MANIVSDKNVTLPALHTIMIDASSSSSLAPPSNADQASLPSFNMKSQHDQQYSPPNLPFPLSCHRPMHCDHYRCVSTCSRSSTPSLTHSRSPSPVLSSPPTRPTSPNSFLLVPCAMNVANAVIVITEKPATATTDLLPSPNSDFPPKPPVLRPCKPSEARATLLIGPAISAHARTSAAIGERRMHPYRIVRRRRDSH